MKSDSVSSEQRCADVYEKGKRCELECGHELPHVHTMGNGDQLRWHECDWVDAVEGPDVVGKVCSVCGEERGYSDD